MSTVTSCTFLSIRPAVSSAGGLQSKKPTAFVSLASERKSRPLSPCFAISSNKPGDPKIDVSPFSISPVVLVNPVPVDGERWQVAENKDEVSLWFDVPGLSPADLIVEIDEDVLVIKKKKKASPKSNYNTPTSGAIADHQEATADEFSGGGIYARLLLPAGYSREGVQAKLTSGVLKLTIAKVKESVRRKINVDISVK
ncbi:hypothetical protein OsI_32806 [Oryza sativa Indica Group]|uniref:SHSP domain-containing protein n=1 Tax=Oryza sativa subsp. indica TaxID=39946 RepID=A2Z584_ORYSI|nr:hypothetical protein OsI_32806 [Oryza sativa Indica Group]